MSDFTPNFRILIDGVDYASSTIANMTSTSGRTDIYSQPVAGYVSLELVNLNNEAVVVQIDDGVTIQVQDTSGNWINLAGGDITDLIHFVKNAGSVTNVTSTQVTALGALARLPKATTEGVLSSDLEGIQIQIILQELLAGQWNEVPAGESWDNYDPTSDWNSAENLGLG